MKIAAKGANENPGHLLARFFERNGYVRTRSEELAKQLGQKYKKGYEVRIVAGTQGELQEIRRLIRKSGFKLGKAFKKNSQMVQPIYGRQEVERFLTLVRKPKDGKKSG